MRVVHISDRSFITIPEGASLLVNAESGHQIKVGPHYIDFYCGQGMEAYEKSIAHVISEYRRFIEWLCSDDRKPFRFDPGYPVRTIETGEPADEPARLVGTLEPPLPVAAEVAGEGGAS